MKKYYDTCVYWGSDLHKLITSIKSSGYSGVVITRIARNKSELKKASEDLKQIRKLEFEGIDIYTGIELRADSSVSLKKLIYLATQYDFDIVGVLGGDIDINKTTVSSDYIDILRAPYLGRRDSGIDKPIAHLATEHQVSIEVVFKHLVGKNKYFLYSSLQELYNYCKHFKINFLLSTGAKDIYELRRAKNLIFFLKSLFSANEFAESILSENPWRIFEQVKRRGSADYINPCVRIIK